MEAAISQATGTTPVGGEVVYSVVVTNKGPNNALGVLMTYQLPSNVIFKSAVATQGRCVEVSGLVECTLGTFPIGTAASVTITVIPTEGSGGTVVTNTARVTSGSEESRVPGSGVIRGRGSGERETTASSLAGKEESSRKEDNSGQGKDGPAGAIAQGGNGR